MYPSFKSQYGRDPIAGHDFEKDNCMDQDDYEYFTGTGNYTDNPINTCEHGKITRSYQEKEEIENLMEQVRRTKSMFSDSNDLIDNLDYILMELWNIKYPCYTCYTAY